jgi:bidirectional [NiFe] hydrogenase diaphorase subunit
MVGIAIDGQLLQAEEGAVVMAIARAQGIKIPGLCYHPALKPLGACKLCTVEVARKAGRRVATLACALKAKSGLEIWTQGDQVSAARTRAFHELFRLAPESRVIRDLAAECGIDLGPLPDGCIRCGLCVRVCQEVVGAGALKMAPSQGGRLVVPISNRCIGCGTCVSICPTKVIHLEDREDVRVIGIREEVIGRLPLAHCEHCGKLFATRRFLEFVTERTTTHVDVKEHHAYCTTCAKLLSNRIKSSIRSRSL